MCSVAREKPAHRKGRHENRRRNASSGDPPRRRKRIAGRVDEASDERQRHGRPHHRGRAARQIARLSPRVRTGRAAGQLHRHRRPGVAAGPRSPGRRQQERSAAGTLSRTDGHVRLLAETAAVRPHRGRRSRRRGTRSRGTWTATTLIDQLGLRTTELYQKGARRGHQPAAAGHARALHPGREAVGRRSWPCR